MSLLKLLATGKSLVGLKQATGRYRVTRERLLPQFGSKNNPFQQRDDEAQTSAGPLQNVALPEPSTSESSQPEPTVAPCDSGPAKGSPERLPVLAEPVRHKVAGWANKCVAKLATGIRVRPSKPAKSAFPAFTKALVQGELSLERVKVVRNDLSDSDLDIVRSRAEAAPRAAASSTVEQPDAEPASKAWRVTGRFFGAGKT